VPLCDSLGQTWRPRLLQHVLVKMRARWYTLVQAHRGMAPLFAVTLDGHRTHEKSRRWLGPRMQCRARPLLGGKHHQCLLGCGSAGTLSSLRHVHRRSPELNLICQEVSVKRMPLLGRDILSFPDCWNGSRSASLWTCALVKFNGFPRPHV